MAIKIVSPVEKLVVNGTGGTLLDVQGSAGQLFSVTDSLTGDLFAVSDISGIPILNVNSSGAVDIDGTLAVDGSITAVDTVTLSKGIQVTSPGSSFYNKFGSANDYTIGLNDSAGSTQWYFKTYTNGTFAIHENGVADKFTIAAGGNATFAGNVILNSRLTFDYGGDHYLEAGTDALSYKSSGGGAVMTLNASTSNATFASNVYAGGDLTVAGGDVYITKQNDAPTLTLLHDGTNPSTNDLLFVMQFQSDYEGTHQNWGKIICDTNNSAVRTNLDFLVKSASGGEQIGFRIEGQPSETPKAYFYNDVDVDGDLTATNLSGTNTGDQTFATLGAATSTNYTLKFQPPTSSYAGFQFLDTSGNGAGYLLIRGTSDTGAYTAEGISLIADAGWLTLAQRTTSDKGIRFMTGATATTRMTIANNGDVDIVGDLTADNLSGTNTGDQTLPTLSSLGALPLAGGTMTGELIGTTASFTGGGNTLILKKGTGNAALTFAGTAADPEASALIEGIAGGGMKFYTSDGGTLGTPAWTARLTISATGTATFANSLSAYNLSGTNTGDQTLPTLSSLGAAPLASPALTGTPTAPTAGATVNTTQLATTAFVQTAVSNLVDSSPGALNTLNELAAALGDDASFSTTVATSIGTKLPLAGGTLTGNLSIQADSAFFFVKSADYTLSRIIPRGVGADLDKGLFSLYSVGTENVRIDSAGNSWFNGGGVGIGTTNPSEKLEVVGIIESTTNGNRVKGNISLGIKTNNSAKWHSITGTQYGYTAEPEGYSLINGASGDGVNAVNMGGGLNEQNAATQVSLWTAANVSTRTGTERMRIASDGTITFHAYGAGILKTNATGVISLDTNTYSTATGVENNADVTDTANVVGALTAGTNVQIATDGTISSTNTTYNFAGSSFTSRNSGNATALDSSTSNMVGYVTSSQAATAGTTSYTDGGLFVAAYSSSWVSQIFSDFRTGEISVRGKNNGTWQDWRFVHDSEHFSVADVANGVTAYGWGDHGLSAQDKTDIGNLSGTNTGDQTLSSLGALSTTGKAADSELLDGINSTSFTRSDANDTISGKINFTHNTTADPLAAVEINGGGNHTGLYINPAASKQAHIRFGTNGTMKWQIRAPFQDSVDTALKFYSWVNSEDKFVFNHDGSASFNGGTVWTSTNDGASSGLDADTVDGLQATAFATSAQGTLATNALPKAGGTMTGNLTVSSGTNGDSTIIIESDTDNSNENDNPQLHFKQDGGLVNAYAGLVGDGGNIFTGSATNAAYFGVTNDVPLQLFTNSNSRLTINGNGTINLEAYGAGILKTDTNGLISLDTNTYSTASGVEDNADVTDATNVAAAGALMTAGGTLTGQLVTGSGGLGIVRSSTNGTIWFNSGTDVNHALWNAYYGESPTTRGSANTGFDGMFWNTLRGLKIRGGSAGAYNLIVAENSTGSTNDHTVKLYASNVLRLQTTTTGVSVTGDIKIDSALLSNQENIDVDSAAAETVAQVAHATYTAAFFDFVIKNGTNVRAGTVYSCHDGTNVEFTETSTVDLGDTSDVSLSVDISGTNMRLRATTTSDNWIVKSLVRAI